MKHMKEFQNSSIPNSEKSKFYFFCLFSEYA
jgi:hypothetical protein